MPVPKVIDFGIAKATEGRLTDATVYTQLHQFIGTPAYMSPEQAEMSGLDIDTRSDIYSLGVLLYELLVGSTPFDANELMASGLDAMRRTIREKEPVRPSTRFATLEGAELTTAAKRRSCDVPKLIHLLQGDLDWIVMKCLEKDRARRYETANGLAADLKRHLENEPVVARPPSMAYRLQKAYRRNKLVFSAGVAIVLALVAGLALAAIGWSQTRVERDKAVQARAAEEAQRSMAQASELKAQAQALAARRSAYDSDMNLAQQALAMNNLGRAQTLLNRQRPQPGQLDLRGWEWRYLWSQTRPDDHEVFFTGTNRLEKSLSFSADGRLLLREYRGETVVTDLMSRRTVLQRTNTWKPAFTHHGTTLAFASDISSTNSSITLLDLATQQETQFVASIGTVKWLGFTPDDQRLLTVSERTDARTSSELPYYMTAWDIDTKGQLWHRAIDWAAGDSVNKYRTYAISPDGAAVAAVFNSPPRLQVLEMKDGSERFTITPSDEWATCVMFSPDSSTLLTGAGFTDSTIRLWDAHTGKASGILEGHRSFVSDLLFTPEGKRLISSSGDQTIRLWDWSMLQPAGVLRGHLSEIDGLALAPDGRTLASRCKDGSIYLWDVTKPSRHLGYRLFPSRWKYGYIEFTQDSRSILEPRYSGGELLLRDPLTLRETRRSWTASTNGHVISVCPDGSQVAQFDFHGHLLLWDARTGLETAKSIANGNYFAVDLSHDWKVFATARADGTNLVLETWDTDTWQPKGSLITTLDGAYDIYGTSQTNIFLIRNQRGFRLIDLTTPNETPKQIEHKGLFESLAFSPDGRMAAVAYNEGFIQLWDMATLQPLETLRGFLLGVHSVAFSPDGKRLAAGSSGHEAVKLWDTETRQEVLTLSGEGSVFELLRFSPDGRYLMAINFNGVIHLWSAPTWEEIKTAEAEDVSARN